MEIMFWLTLVAIVALISWPLRTAQPHRDAAAQERDRAQANLMNKRAEKMHIENLYSRHLLEQKQDEAREARQRAQDRR